MADLMPLIPLASTSDDGLASWRQFMQGFEAHVSGQQALIPIIGMVAGFLALTWFNVWLIRRLTRDRTGAPSQRR